MHIYIIILLLLIIYTVQDIKYKKIHIIYGCVAAVLILSCICIDDISYLMSSLGGVGVGVLLYAFSIITKEQIGKGDAVLLMITGLGLGFWNNLSFFFISLICASLYSLIKITKSGFHRKQQIPFVPFLLAGYMIFIIAQFT